MQYFLSCLSDKSVTGPDGIGAKILKLFAKELSIPAVFLIRRILSTGEWPEIWCYHWICPLFKRKSPADPD